MYYYTWWSLNLPGTDPIDSEHGELDEDRLIALAVEQVVALRVPGVQAGVVGGGELPTGARGTVVVEHAHWNTGERNVLFNDTLNTF